MEVLSQMAYSLGSRGLDRDYIESLVRTVGSTPTAPPSAEMERVNPAVTLKATESQLKTLQKLQLAMVRF